MAAARSGRSWPRLNVSLVPGPPAIRIRKTRLRSAPATSSRGQIVSAAASSADRMMQLPIGAMPPSGHGRPALTRATRSATRDDFPTPGSPAISAILPRASRGFQSQSIDCCSNALAPMSSTRLPRGGGGAPPIAPASAHRCISHDDRHRDGLLRRSVRARGAVRCGLRGRRWRSCVQLRPRRRLASDRRLPQLR